VKLTRNRNLYNGDCSFLFTEPARYNPAYRDGSAAEMLETIRRFVRMLADCGVDTFVLNPNTQLAYYPSKAVPTALDGYRRGDREHFRVYGHCLKVPPDKMDEFLDGYVRYMNRYLDLLDAGIDWIAETAKCCRECGISPWLSIRMIDIHGSHDPENNFDSCPLYRDKQYRLHYDDPRIRFINRFLHPPDGWWDTYIGLNFEMTEVRDYMFAMIRELVNDYDFEGIELDWLRSPICCRPDASEQTIQTITDWTASMHALTQAKAQKTARPWPLGLRVPANLDGLRSIGLDVKAMARAGVIDFVGLSHFWDHGWAVPFDRVRADLGDETTLYGVIERRATRHSSNIPAAEPHDALMRGSAAGMLALGVDGIEQFNFFCGEGDGDYAALRGLNDLDFLRGKPKRYAVPTALAQVRLPPFEVDEQLPAVLEPHSRRTFRASMCAESDESGLEWLIQVIVEKAPTLPMLGLSVNGSWPAFDGATANELFFPVGEYVPDASAYQAFNFSRAASCIRGGWNEIAIYNTNAAVRIVSIECLVGTP
jgi:hypothetical protein